MRCFSTLAVVLFVSFFPVFAQNGELLWARATEWGEIRVRQNGDIRILSFAQGGKETEESRTLITTPHQPQAYYVKQMAATSSALFDAQHEQQFLVVGLGAGSLSLALAHQFPRATITSVEIEPAVVEAARRFFFYQESEKLLTVIEDARSFLSSTEQQYDAIFLDAFDGVEVPETLRSVEFAELLKRRLRAQGVVVANVHFVPQEPSLRYQKSLHEVFPFRFMATGTAQGVGIYSVNEIPDLSRTQNPLLRPAFKVQLENVEPYRDR